MSTASQRRRHVLAALASMVVLTAAPAGRSAAAAPEVRTWTIHYVSHDGVNRVAYVVLPAWYGPRDHPLLPVVISPHGRGADGRSNAKLWGDLPAIGGFGVINPDGMGRRLPRFSYGYPGQIDDLARMPDIAAKVLPWLRIDRRRIYALGSSMGGQETLLLVARHPRLLAGAAALDSVTDLARRYRELPTVPCSEACLHAWGKPYGLVLQSLLRDEVGGSPDESPGAYAARSALDQADRIASSGVPLQVWWSRDDRIVADQEHQSAALVERIRALNRCAPITEYVGWWAHSVEMRADRQLPVALIGFDLLPPGSKRFRGFSQQGAATTCPA
jgi:poly(3-hydroxybutyrate) depolymerase